MPKYLSISLSVAIFLIFGYTLFQNALNAPSFDDYDATVNFIRRFFFENFDPRIRFEIMLGRQNEHRILVSKAVAAAYYYLFGEINFAHLVWIQNIFLFAFFALMLAIMQNRKLLSADTVLWAAIFLFSLAFWQVTFYYWGGIQHYSVFFFSFLLLLSLERAERIVSSSFFIALFAGVFAVLSFGNGFIALLLGCFLLFAKKKKSLLVAWSVITVLLTLFALFPRPVTVEHIQNAFNFEWMGRLLFTYLGSFLFINPISGLHFNIILCMITGLLVFGTWLWLLWNGYAFRRPLLYCLLSLPILTGIIIAVSRFESKAAGGIAPRYMFFTATIPVLLVLILLDMQILKKQHLRWLTGIGLVLWSAVFYNDRRALISHNEEVVTTLQRWERDPETPLIYYKDSREYAEILAWAVANGVVKIPGGQNHLIDNENRK